METIRATFEVFGEWISAALRVIGISPGMAVAILGTLLVLAAAFPFAWQRVATGWDAHRRHIPRALQANLTALLSNGAVLRFYAPDERFIRDLGEEEKKRPTLAWLSPWRRAVKATMRRHGRVLKSQTFDARRQVRAAAAQVIVRPLDDKEASQWQPPEDEPFAVYAAVLNHDGRPPQEVLRLKEHITSQLKAGGGVFPVDDGDPTKTTFIVCEKKIEDALVTTKRAREFFDENPAKSPQRLPMAYTATGETWSLPTHHTLVFGMTGSGKSGPLLATIWQLADFVEQGTVELWGIDPKNSDIGMFGAGTSMFGGGVATTTEDAIDTINRFYHDMKYRNDNKHVDLKNGETGQKVKVSRKTPMNVLLIDEFFSLKADLDGEGKPGKAAWSNLTKILAQGRSASFYVIAATQDATQEALKGIRQNFANAIVLSQESAYLNDLMLGEGAKEKGYDSTSIPSSNAANGYRYSGIGFVKGETGDPQRVRFAYLGTDDFAELPDRFPPGQGPSALASLSAGVAQGKPKPSAPTIAESTSWFFDGDDDAQELPEGHQDAHSAAGAVRTGSEAAS